MKRKRSGVTWTRSCQIGSRGGADGRDRGGSGAGDGPVESVLEAAGGSVEDLEAREVNAAGNKQG